MYAVVVDVETSGLPHQQHAGVLSLGAIVVERESGREVESFHTYVLPELVNVKEYVSAQRFHGIQLATLASHGKPAAEAVAAFDFFWARFGRPQLHAYNVEFEKEMLRRAGFDQPLSWGPCIMGAAADYFGRNTGRIALDKALAEAHLAGRSGATHDALEDARLAHALARHCGLLIPEWRK